MCFSRPCKYKCTNSLNCDTIEWASQLGYSRRADCSEVQLPHYLSLLALLPGTLLPAAYSIIWVLFDWTQHWLESPDSHNEQFQPPAGCVFTSVYKSTQPLCWWLSGIQVFKNEVLSHIHYQYFTAIYIASWGTSTLMEKIDFLRSRRNVERSTFIKVYISLPSLRPFSLNLLFF